MSGTPFYLRGNFAPVEEEIGAFDLKVEGEIPESLNGLFLRNGPNPTRGDPGHWFLGDGMIHGTRPSGQLNLALLKPGSRCEGMTPAPTHGTRPS